MSVAEEGRERAPDGVGQRSLRDLRNCQALLAAAVFLAACMAIKLTGLPSLRAQLALLVPAVAVALPHGALDGRDGRKLFAPRYGRLWFVPFLSGYAALFGATLTLWWLAPFLALLAFLAISLVHFAQCDRNAAGRFPRVSTLAHGGVPVVLPALAFPTEVEQLFGWLVGEQDAATVLALLTGPVAVAWSVAVVVGIAEALMKQRVDRDPNDARTSFAITGVLLLLFNTVPPILAFALYFALFHAPRAFLQASDGEGLDTRAAIGAAFRDAVPLTVTAIAIGIVLFLLQPVGDGTPAVMRSVFLLLSALTVPHMWLEHIQHPRTNARPDIPHSLQG